SGSTGKPKGVMVQHQGFVNLLHWYTREFEIDYREKNLLIAPIGFDLAQKNLFCPLFSGGTLYPLPMESFDYEIITELIHEEKITMINCAPSAFYPFMEIDAASFFARLQSLRKLFLGGESIQWQTLLPWSLSQNFHCRIFNTYGPTECTDVVSSYPIPTETVRPGDVIPIGRPVDNVKLHIVNKDMNVQPVGLHGELCISGIGVARGYINRPELTREKFLPNPFTYGMSSRSTIYKTGDLARWLSDGNIEFLGRIDSQVKVRGFRVELGEIENQLLKLEGIKEAVVLTKQNKKGENYLCSYFAPNEKGHPYSSDTKLRKALALNLPDHMIPSFFIELDTLPLTPNGKINRRALPEPEIKKESGYIAPRNATEKRLAEIWSEVLDAPLDSIGIDNNFFQLGGHSLKATILVSFVHKRMNIKMPLAEVFKCQIIREQAEFIVKSAKCNYKNIEPVEKREYYQLSSAQKRLYFLQQMEPESTAYNMTANVSLGKEVDKSKLASTLMKLIERHESLRTSFHMIEDTPVQRVQPDVELEIEYLKLTGTTKFEDIGFVRYFELAQAPLIRSGLVELPDGNNIWIVDMH
ncbi:MAG: AMP-binding protein, partial [bacterium]|nr:AMP-binding protein [bacterium]